MGKIYNIWDYIACHKYLITVLVCVLVFGVIDDNSLRAYWILSMRLNEDRDRLEAYEEQFYRDSVRLHNFNASLKGVETIARERYKMKRADEDVFILSTEKNFGSDDDEKTK